MLVSRNFGIMGIIDILQLVRLKSYSVILVRLSVMSVGQLSGRG